jgi:hypothetical protein
MAALPYLDCLPSEVTENIASFLKGEHREWGLADFRALRLTCKDLYMETFRLYGVTYFTNASVSFTAASLHRLQYIARYTNKHGLYLSSFLKALRCSTYRLPMGDAVGTLLIPATHLTESAETGAKIEAIALACRIGIERAIVAGPYNSRIQAIVQMYRKATMEQQSLECNGRDIKSLAKAMAALKSLKAVSCVVGSQSWGEMDWSTIAGIDRASFSFMEFKVSGKSNLTCPQHIALNHADISWRQSRRKGRSSSYAD